MVSAQRRRRNKKMKSRHDLPEEIIEDIIVKLPFKSIIRFQRVCKSWLHLIKSSRFIRKHLIESEESFLAMSFVIRDSELFYERVLTIRLYDDQRKTSAPWFLECMDRFDSVEAADYALPVLDFELPRLSPRRRTYLDLVGHCNGIMCLMIDNKMILLVNPSLQEVKTLPILPEGYACKLVGFGFDNITMDFMVVRTLSWNQSDSVGKQRAEVYDRWSNAWRELNDFTFVFDYANKCSTFFDGVIHWCVTTKLFGWKMLTFNMASELFQQKEFPEGWYDPEGCWYDGDPALFVLNQESLVFVSCQFLVSLSPFVNVWKMNKLENEEAAWTKIYSIGPLTQPITPISFLKEHKFLYKTRYGKLILYDLLSRQSFVVCNDITELQRESLFLDPRLEMEMGVCRSSFVSIM